MSDKEVLAWAYEQAKVVRKALIAQGLSTTLTTNDDRDNPGYLVGAEGPGPLSLHVEVIASPWENDGTVTW